MANYWSNCALIAFDSLVNVLQNGKLRIEHGIGINMKYKRPEEQTLEGSSLRIVLFSHRF